MLSCKASRNGGIDPNQVTSIGEGMNSIKAPKKELPLELSDRFRAWRAGNCGGEFEISEYELIWSH
jgi:hypothetical protein